MTDIVERLLDWRKDVSSGAAEEAAAEIRRLREQCEALVKILHRTRRALAVQPHPLTSSGAEEKRTSLGDIDQIIAAYRTSEKG